MYTRTIRALDGSGGGFLERGEWHSQVWCGFLGAKRGRVRVQETGGLCTWGWFGTNVGMPKKLGRIFNSTFLPLVAVGHSGSGWMSVCPYCVCVYMCVYLVCMCGVVRDRARSKESETARLLEALCLKLGPMEAPGGSYERPLVIWRWGCEVERTVPSHPALPVAMYVCILMRTEPYLTGLTRSERGRTVHSVGRVCECVRVCDRNRLPIIRLNIPLAFSTLYLPVLFTPVTTLYSVPPSPVHNDRARVCLFTVS